MRNFMELIRQQWQLGKFLCVGLDSEISKVRPLVYSVSAPDWPPNGLDEGYLYLFNMRIIDATAEFAAAYKPNRAFYARLGVPGLRALQNTVEYIHDTYPDIPVILDAKEADIENTNLGYAAEAFDLLGADALTVHPYLGGKAIQPFFDYKDKGIIVLCRTSNKGAGELQDLWVSAGGDVPTMPLYLYLAHRANATWNTNGNCAVVVGATYPDELARVRQIVGNMPILIPGIGAQGGDVQATVEAGQDENGEGMIINASRSIIFASNDPRSFVDAAREEAKRLHELINMYRKKV